MAIDVEYRSSVRGEMEGGARVAGGENGSTTEVGEEGKG